MNHQGHHRHTQYIIENSEIFGFSPAERATISAIARYLGKSRPAPLEKPLRAVPAGPAGGCHSLRCPAASGHRAQSESRHATRTGQRACLSQTRSAGTARSTRRS